MKKILLLGVSLVAMFCFLNAEGTGKILGYVSDENGAALPFATIWLEGTRIGAQADENGYYEIVNLEEGTYTLVVSMIGFAAERVENIKLNKGQIIEIRKVLEEARVVDYIPILSDIYMEVDALKSNIHRFIPDETGSFYHQPPLLKYKNRN